MSEPGNPADQEGREGNLLVLAVLSLAGGALTGLVGAGFRLALAHAERLRGELVEWGHGLGVGVGIGAGIAGFVVFLGVCAAATAVAAWLVRRFSPESSGSGIPHVEAVLSGAIPQAPARLIVVKFVGGVLAIGSGLALGREGPSVQMGAGVAHLMGKVSRRNWPDCRALLAAGAGAGLATAFNAPIAGAVFVLEELVRKFETRMAIVALGASAVAIWVARSILGDAPDFQVLALPAAGMTAKTLFFALGAGAGLAAILYNRAILGAIGVANRMGKWSAEQRAAAVGAAVGAVAWFGPELVGGGDPLTQRALAGIGGLGVVPLVFLLRFGLGPASYAARTPGGLFAPILTLGAQFGLVFGLLCRLAFPDAGIQPEGFAVVGMAAFFTGVVRAPVTGIILMIEMTASFSMLLPMLGASFTAMLVTTLLRSEPIYDSLRIASLPAAGDGVKR